MARTSTKAPKSGDAYRFKYHSTLKGFEKPHYIYIYECTTEAEARDVFWSELPPGMDPSVIIIDELKWVNKVPSVKNNPGPVPKNKK